MSFRVLLTGSEGQLGWELQKYLAPLGEVIATNRQTLDLTNPEQLRSSIRTIRPNLIVNPAAYTAVDQAESDQATAHAVNAEAPRVMAEQARVIGGALIHYSTDYVFDGAKRQPYEESDRTNPLNVYGRTKLAGEIAIQRAGVPYLILRTGWVYSLRGKNFLLTILRLAKEKEELRVVNDQYGAPTWSRALACATAAILRSGGTRRREMIEQHAGVYHLSAAGQTTWYDFAQTIIQTCGSDPGVRQKVSGLAERGFRVKKITAIPTSQFPTAARRPPYSVLSNRKITEIFGIHLPDWQTQLEAALSDHATVPM